MSGRRVAVVCDSTASLPPEVVAAQSITIVPLDVVVAGRAIEETELAEGELLAALRRRRPVTTSRPSPARFSAAFSRLAAEGVGEIVSVHLSGEVSGAGAAARLAAGSAGLPVRVVDTGQLAMGVGYAALAAVRAASQGRTGTEVAAAASASAARTQVYFAVETLEYLRRGGRVSLAGAVVGSALSVKPLLAVRDGRIELRERVRTTARAVERLAQLALRDVAAWRSAGAGVAGSGEAGSGDVVAGEVVATVQHLGSPERAAGLAARLAEELGVDVPVLSVSAVIGAHVGPGVIGVAVAAR